MSKKKDLVKSTLILTVGKSASQVISFLLLPLYTAFLSPKDFGIVDLIVTYITLLVPVITIQLEMVAFRFLVDARDDEIEKERVISNILHMDILATILIALFYLLVSHLLHIDYLSLVVLNIIVTVFSNLFLQIARGFGDNKRYAIASIVIGFITLITAVLFVAVLHLGVTGVLLSITLSSVVSAIYLFVSLRLYSYINFKNHDMALKKNLMRYSLPLVPNGISWWVINVSDRTIVSIFVGLASNGIYAVANKFSSIFTSIFSIFSLSWTESASMHINDDDRDEFFSDTASSVVEVFGSLGLLLIAFMPFVFPLIIDKKYNEALLYIPILTLAAFFYAIVGIYSAVYVAKKMTKQVATTSIFAAIINIVLNLLFVKSFGIWAAAISTAIAYGVMAIYRHYDMKKYVNLQYKSGLLLKIAAAYILAIAFYYWNTELGNIINAIIAMTVAYTFNKDTVSGLLSIIKNIYGKRNA
jgi:O-antigen/teichoic acid export membrane protein